VSRPERTSADPLLVGLDLDGTLLSYDGDLSPAVVDAVAGVRAAGHHVVLATGRTIVSTLPVVAQLGLDDGWVVCSNGAVTARLDRSRPSGYVLHEAVTFDPAPALRVVADGIPDALVAVEDVGVGHRVNRPFPDGELWGPQSVATFEDLCARPVTRVIVRSPERTRDDFHELVEHLGLGDVTYAIGWTAWMDVAPLGVTKATALESVRRELGVEPHLTVAIGDGRNDLDMLAWAARGVAMGHADDVVRGAADEVTGTVGEDGAATVLLSLVS
jgi:hydroxymethylpyrimidine pyrophosphatase-like HAD family hydrolase